MSDMYPFEEVSETEKPLKNPALDPDTNRFVESEDILEKENQKYIQQLKTQICIPHLRIDNYQVNVEKFYQTQPFFYDKAGIFWIWNIVEDRYEIVDDVDMMNLIDVNLKFMGQTVGKGIRGNYIEAFKRVGRQRMPKTAPNKWIQFKNKAYSITSDKTYTVTPAYFFTNPIPWPIGKSDSTPVIDRLFAEWVGKEDVTTLYEIIAYCLYRDYPIHRVFFLLGDGCNGKTTYLQIINKFIGIQNICSTELDNIVGNNHSRFETMKMYKKLACLMGETNLNSMGKTSMLKKLSGHDLIGFEMKGKNPFDDYSYAKLIIASNGLPVTNDTSDGFNRRCLTVEFPNKFTEGRDILAEIPDVEYSNLACKSLNYLRELLKNGGFTNEGTIDDRRHKYAMASNPLPIFIRKFCRQEPDYYHRYGDLYNNYIKWLKENKKRVITKKEFSKHLNEEGIEIRKTSKEGEVDYYVEGLRFFLDFPDSKKSQLDHMGIPPISTIEEIREIKEKIEEDSWASAQKCNMRCFVEGCLDYECAFDSSGTPYCRQHWEEMRN